MPSQQPQVIAHYEDCAILSTGREFFNEYAHDLMRGQYEGRYADLCGPDIAKVIPLVGWYYIGKPVCLAAVDDQGKTIGMGWCAPVRGDNGQIGANISYAVDSEWEGRGLGKLLSAMAFEIHDLTDDRSRFVNIQCRASNSTATAIAKSFGMAPHEDGGFSVVLGKQRVAYQGFRMDVEGFRDVAGQTLVRRGQHALLADIDQARVEYARLLAETQDNVAEAADAPR